MSRVELYGSEGSSISSTGVSQILNSLRPQRLYGAEKNLTNDSDNDCQHEVDDSVGI